MGIACEQECWVLVAELLSDHCSGKKEHITWMQV